MAAEVYRAQRTQADPMARALQLLQIGAYGTDIASKSGKLGATPDAGATDSTAPQPGVANDPMKRKYMSYGSDR